MRSPESDETFRRFQVGSVWFSRTNSQNAAVMMESFFEKPPSNNYVCVSNVHITVTCGTDARLREIQNHSFLTIPDGQPIVWHAKLSGISGVERIMGPDLMTLVFQSSPHRSHYFLGGSETTLAAMRENLLRLHPALQIAGMHSPPFRALSTGEQEEIRGRIQKAAPDYLWVCLGAPKQEYWMGENHAHFPKTLIIGIGAGFAYHAGELKRAPVWAQKLACEWVWRLWQEPSRLWKRYLLTNPVFVGMLLRQLARRLSGRTA